MYSVTKRIDFCYGHRLLDYDGICKHPHGHNAVAEIEVRTGQLDNRNMVCDFSDIKRVVKGWIDSALDHKMLLRHDDPLVKPLQQLGEPVYLLDSNPTVERIARLIFDYATAQKLFEVAWSSGAGASIDELIEREGLKQLSDAGAIDKLVDEVLAANARQVEDYRAGKEKAFNSLVGQVMKASKGKANPAQVNEILRRKLAR